MVFLCRFHFLISLNDDKNAFLIPTKFKQSIMHLAVTENDAYFSQDNMRHRRLWMYWLQSTLLTQY